MDDLFATIRALARAFPHACLDLAATRRSFAVHRDCDQVKESVTEAAIAIFVYQSLRKEQ